MANRKGGRFAGSAASGKLEILKERRSIRKFTAEEGPRPMLMELIDYAAWAPSATNRQPWRFIIVDDPAVKGKIVDAGGSVLIGKAPCGILVTYENTTRNVRYHDDYQSAGACIQNLLLAAHARGLGACWLCTLPSPSFLRKLLDIPDDFSPVAYVIVGYPQNPTTKIVPRKAATEEVVGHNRFPDHAPGTRRSRLLLSAERCLIGSYDRLPVWLKKNFVNRLVDKGFTKKFDN